MYNTNNNRKHCCRQKQGIKEFKQEFAQIECLNPNYIGIIISDNNDIVVYPTDENGQNQCYKY